MSGYGLIGSLIVGAIAGWLAGQVWRGGGFGLIGNIIVGIIGALVGNFLAGLLGLGGTASGGIIWGIIIATIGAVVLLWIINMVTGRRTT
ncbi:MAG TPA: GlsB/YeaQ/YmgE family stress response membrane protein [Ardenticatenaceae bacterium]|nr:GlsB/YeaQ/YmgE family stress response membrane protein [Ardenticatenaceae bacterium]